MAAKNTKKKEREETLMRIVAGVVSGIILYVWAWLIGLFFIINFFYSLFSGKKLKELSDLSEIWNLQLSCFINYMDFSTSKRPFPFKNLKKN